MLNYDEETPLEDVLMRSFTADQEQFGERIEVELKPGGKDILITRENRKEFVELFIDFEFRKQCEPQLASLKKGFERMVDLPMLKALLDASELEELVCGERKLNFEELRDTAIYANGFTPNCPMMQWFWDIVLNEWDDAQRRSLLTFSTGSDRAPINGLKSMKFYIV